MVSIRALECLVTIVEQGSLTKAAAVLHMSQPALSHQIAAIERELGTPVVERLPRGIRPTAAGLAAVAEARIALAAAGRAVMEYTSADRMLDVLHQGGADIIVGPPPTLTDEHIEVLGSEEIVVVASAEHRFSHMDAVPLAELTAEPLVHYHPDNGNAIWLDQFAALRGVVLPQPTLRTGSPRTAAQLAAAGMGVAVVPFSALTPPPGGTIRSVDPPELRDVIAIVAAPHDDLLRRFVSDLKRRGLPDSRLPHLSRLVPLSGTAGAAVMPGDARPVATNGRRAP